MDRIEPTAPAGTLSGAARLFDFWAIAYRRTWKGTAISSFVTPLLYVLAMGVLLGGFVEAEPARLEGADTYLAFVAPGMVAAHAMTTVFGEATYPVLGKIVWDKAYYSMVASPLGVADIVLAHITFIVARVAVSCGLFVVVMAPFGVFDSVTGAILAVLVQVLVGLAFATPIFAYAVSLRADTGFAPLFRLGMIPMFLFSGAFFPVANLAGWMEAVARLTPLWHGVDLTRMLTLGTLEAGPAAVHVAYLLVLAVGGWVVAVRRLSRRMLT